ncbi:ataxin-7-like [Nannospalax galili]|uniref:ataxin-7-like n=1 Tax=Nannospalax galili TaxID=1026970 RepID=UPI00111C0DB1|nr:ataxin-7-like [Nannospalax galili]
MATLWERRPLPSPEAMLGQPWNLWVEASKLPGKDGTELDESLKEFGKNREVMGLCREGSAVKEPWDPDRHSHIRLLSRFEAPWIF